MRVNFSVSPVIYHKAPISRRTTRSNPGNMLVWWVSTLTPKRSAMLPNILGIQSVVIISILNLGEGGGGAHMQCRTQGGPRGHVPPEPTTKYTLPLKIQLQLHKMNDSVMF